MHKTETLLRVNEKFTRGQNMCIVIQGYAGLNQWYSDNSPAFCVT